MPRNAFGLREADDLLRVALQLSNNNGSSDSSDSPPSRQGEGNGSRRDIRASPGLVRGSQAPGGGDRLLLYRYGNESDSSDESSIHYYRQEITSAADKLSPAYAKKSSGEYGDAWRGGAPRTTGLAPQPRSKASKRAGAPGCIFEPDLSDISSSTSHDEDLDCLRERLRPSKASSYAGVPRACSKPKGTHTHGTPADQRASAAVNDPHGPGARPASGVGEGAARGSPSPAAKGDDRQGVASSASPPAEVFLSLANLSKVGSHCGAGASSNSSSPAPARQAPSPTRRVHFGAGSSCGSAVDAGVGRGSQTLRVTRMVAAPSCAGGGGSGEGGGVDCGGVDGTGKPEVPMRMIRAHEGSPRAGGTCLLHPISSNHRPCSQHRPYIGVGDAATLRP